MNSQLKLLGNWPISGTKARKNKKMCVIRDDDTLDLIHGKDNHVLISFHVSNDGQLFL